MVERDGNDNDAERLYEACAQLPEAPALAWTKFESPAGFVWSFTIRAGLPGDLTRAALTQIREQIALFEQGARVYSWRPVADGRDVTAMPAGQQRDEMPSMANNNGGGIFAAEELVANVHDGKVYWKVKGGRFKQYGVTIWPEVLEKAGFHPEKMDPMATYDIHEFMAHYVVNDKGNPSKIIELVLK